MSSAAEFFQGFSYSLAISVNRGLLTTRIHQSQYLGKGSWLKKNAVSGADRAGERFFWWLNPSGDPVQASANKRDMRKP